MVSLVTQYLEGQVRSQACFESKIKSLSLFYQSQLMQTLRTTIGSWENLLLNGPLIMISVDAHSPIHNLLAYPNAIGERRHQGGNHGCNLCYWQAGCVLESKSSSKRKCPCFFDQRESFFPVLRQRLRGRFCLASPQKYNVMLALKISIPTQPFRLITERKSIKARASVLCSCTGCQ